MKEEFILCAAVKRIKPRQLNPSPYHDGTNDILEIELGYRHHDIFQRFRGELRTGFKDQGFYTSKGRFVDRYEAMYIAWKAKQVSDEYALKSKLKLPKVNFIDDKEVPEESSYNHNYNKKFNPLFSENLY